MDRRRVRGAAVWEDFQSQNQLHAACWRLHFSAFQREYGSERKRVKLPSNPLKSGTGRVRLDRAKTRTPFGDQGTILATHPQNDANTDWDRAWPEMVRGRPACCPKISQRPASY